MRYQLEDTLKICATEMRNGAVMVVECFRSAPGGGPATARFASGVSRRGN